MPINEIELNRMASTRKKSATPNNTQPDSCSSVFVLFLVCSPRSLHCDSLLLFILKFAIFYDAGAILYNLHIVNQDGLRFFCVCVSVFHLFRSVQRCQRFYDLFFFDNSLAFWGNWLICSKQSVMCVDAFIC